ncbi:uncharacterized protein ISCGN_013060 [Ixodes scapularis]
MEEKFVGLLNVEAMIGIPGAFDIGVPVEVPNGEPFSLPLSGTPITSDAARPRSVDLVLSFDTTAEPSRPSSVRPRHTSQADNIPERPQGDADVHGASGGGLEESEVLPCTSGSRRSNHKRSRDAPSHEIIQTQEAIVERLDRIVVLQEQMVALKAYKLNVRFENGKIVPSNRSLVVFGVACLAVSRRSLRSFLAERRPKTYRRALYVPLSGGGCKRGLHRYCHHHSLKQGSAWLCVPLSTGGRKRGLHRNCHHHSLKTYSRALPRSASLCPVVVASEACTVIAITIVGRPTAGLCLALRPSVQWWFSARKAQDGAWTSFFCFFNRPRHGVLLKVSSDESVDWGPNKVSSEENIRRRDVLAFPYGPDQLFSSREH